MITFCVPTYKNNRDQLSRCFESLSGLSNASILILVDDDDSDYLQLVRDCAAVSGICPEIITQKNSGAFSARKNLCKNTVTSWMFFLDADDYLTPEFVSFCNTFTPNAKYDVYTTKCECLGEYNNFRHTHNKTALSEVENGLSCVMWGKFIKTEVLRQTYKLLPEYPCGLFYGEELPQAWAFRFFKTKSLNIKSVCYTDEGATSIRVISDIKAWKKMLSVVYLVDWYGFDYIKTLLTERLKTVDVTIGKQAISLLRRAMNKTELAQKIFLDNTRKGIPVHQTALELFGNSDPLNYREVLGDDF